ncbi:indolepyruvate ferredoxin oxidoreductase, partial [Escherichia coli]|nr:indolepyruvate ferredoxin oxidoreductase [Escherichia coli]
VEKIEKRWPAGIAFVRDNHLNELFGPEEGDIGVIVQGGLYNNLNRAQELLGLSNAYGDSELPIYCLNVAYPLIPEEVVAFCRGK